MSAPSGPSSSSRPMSPTLSLDEQDESVRIAVRALGDMRSRAIANPQPQSSPPLSQFDNTPSSQPTPALSSASTSPSSPSISSQYPLLDDVNSPDFVSRVSHLPIVNTALKAYEQSKANSRVVKYGAEMMESSVKTISRPVIDRLPVNQLDEFACRQLDRLGRYGKSPTEEDSSPDRRDMSVERGRNASWSTGLQIRDSSMASSSRVGHRSDHSSESGPRERSESRSREDDNPERQQQVAQRSTWQSVLLEAGGIGAAVSEESMRRLKYCLQWLQYATSHIDNQILVLRDFIASLQPETGASPDALVSPSHLRTLNDVKRNVIDTVRQVVDVVSKYAGGALPEPARASVRQFILHLPQRWASATQQQAQRQSQGLRATESSAGSPVARPSRQGGVPPTAGAATEGAQRILTLATESLDMIRGVTGVVKDSLDRAEAWVERLRLVGIQRQQQQQGDSTDAAFPPLDARPDGVWDAPSPTGLTTSSLSTLTLSGTHVTPKALNSELRGEFGGSRGVAPENRVTSSWERASSTKAGGYEMDLDG